MTGPKYPLPTQHIHQAHIKHLGDSGQAPSATDLPDPLDIMPISLLLLSNLLAKLSNNPAVDIDGRIVTGIIGDVGSHSNDGGGDVYANA